jgi:hypothetical protein
MNITDQELSAFLDAELNETEMELVRNKIAEDETLANRLAELAMVDEQLAQAYRFDQSAPIPESVSDLFKTHRSKQKNQVESDNVVQFPLWKRMVNQVQQHAAAAVVAAIMLGYGFGSFNSANPDDLDWAQTSYALDHTASGDSFVAVNGAMIKPQASFQNQQGQFCRQYEYSEEQQIQTGLACKQNNQWQVKATIFRDATSLNRNQSTQYQTASSNPVLDALIDQMIKGSFMDRASEKSAIETQWNTVPKI